MTRPRILIYACPADHHDVASWYRYRDRITALLSTGAEWTLRVDDEPLFRYAADARSVTARIDRMHVAGPEIVLVQWSTYVFYSASALILGMDVSRDVVEARMGGERLLRSYPAGFDAAACGCAGYDLHPGSEDGLHTTETLVRLVDDPVYLGPAWMVNDGEGVPDASRFDVLTLRADRRFAAFRPRDQDIASETLKAISVGDGLAIVGRSDPLVSDVALLADATDELSLFLQPVDAKRRHTRVTIGRCHMDDSFTCVYNHPPIARLEPRFMI